MNLQDFEYLENNLDTQGLYGSDTCIANLFLLQEKYNTWLKIHKNILFRYYYGDENLIAPESAVFEGEIGEAYIGDYLPSARKLLYKVGNKITISYVDGTTRVFECRKFEAKAKGLTWYEYVCDESEYALFLDAFMSGKVKKGEKLLKNIN